MDRLSYPEKLVILHFWQENKPMKSGEVVLAIPDYCEGTIQHAVYSLHARGFLGVTKDTEHLKKGRKYYPAISKEEYLFSLCIGYDPDFQKLTRLFERETQ